METFAQPSQQEIPVPFRLASLPKSRGFIVPWFVAWIDGAPEFRILDKGKMMYAIRSKVCWICGQQMAERHNPPFVVGPMCTVNRISAEPPSHVECARYAVQVCPFIARPHMKRRELEPELEAEAKGHPAALPHNPTVAALFFARGYTVMRDRDGVLFQMGTPAGVEWYKLGAPATRKEVEEAFEIGLPLLREAAKEEGFAAQKDLERRIVTARDYLPKRTA